MHDLGERKTLDSPRRSANCFVRPGPRRRLSARAHDDGIMSVLPITSDDSATVLVVVIAGRVSKAVRLLQAKLVSPPVAQQSPHSIQPLVRRLSAC